MKKFYRITNITGSTNYQVYHSVSGSTTGGMSGTITLDTNKIYYLDENYINGIQGGSSFFTTFNTTSEFHMLNNPIIMDSIILSSTSISSADTWYLVSVLTEDTNFNNYKNNLCYGLADGTNSPIPLYLDPFGGLRITVGTVNYKWDTTGVHDERWKEE